MVPVHGQCGQSPVLVPGGDTPISEWISPMGKRHSPCDTWDVWAKTLKDASKEPQELDLLGSSKAPYCIHLFYKGIGKQNVTNPVRKAYKSEECCNHITKTFSASTDKPKVLQWGLFLICGDRAWAGLPSHLQGGPCMLGRLSLLAPNKTQILNWWHQSELGLQKRDLRQLDPNCNDAIVDWSRVKKVAVTFFLPWVATAKALEEISHLECWLGKQANLTFNALSQLLEDEETTRHATLQNRAAMDSLLLAHGRGCEDFEGLCRFNLSSHSKGIHATTQEMQDHIKKLQVEKEPEWFKELFGPWGLKGWLNSLLWLALWVLLIIFIFVCLFGCFKRLLYK